MRRAAVLSSHTAAPPPPAAVAAGGGAGFAGYPRARPEEAGVSAERLARARAVVEAVVADERLAYGRLLVLRRGRLVCDEMVDGKLPSRAAHADGLYRLFSMTKIYVSIALGVLMEKYSVELDDPLSRYIPAFADLRVWTGGEGDAARFEPARSPLTLRHLVTHTGGLSYGGLLASMGLFDDVDRRMVQAGVGVGALISPAQLDAWAANVATLERHCAIVAAQPLKFHPGTAFEYAPGHTLVGRVIEIVSGESLKSFMRREVLDPLGCSARCGWQPARTADLLPLYMFKAAAEQPPRRDPTSGLMVCDDARGGLGSFHVSPRFRALDAAVFGDGQMVGTAEDVMRMTAMLTHRGRAERGRVLSPLMADLIQSNLLPGGVGLDWRHTVAAGDVSNIGMQGPLKCPLAAGGAVGYGSGGMVYRDGAAAATGSTASSPGAYHWQGAACSFMFADRARDVSIVFMANTVSAHDQRELCPSGTLYQRVYAALEDDA